MPNRQRRRVPFRRLFVFIVMFATICVVPSSYAASKSRVFGTALFVAGTGLKLAGVLTRGSAQRLYDDYLMTAVQSDITQLRDDYRSKRRIGTSLSNTGNALLVTGVLFTAISALRSTKADALTSVTTHTNGDNVVVAFNRRF